MSEECCGPDDPRKTGAVRRIELEDYQRAVGGYIETVTSTTATTSSPTRKG